VAGGERGIDRLGRLGRSGDAPRGAHALAQMRLALLAQ